MGVDIGAGEVFDNPPDNTLTVVLAVIDSGVDLDHVDLAANIWVIPQEISGNSIGLAH